jgi:hypothetical protein
MNCQVEICVECLTLQLNNNAQMQRLALLA